MIMLGGWTSIFEKAKANGFDLTVVQRRQSIKPADLAVVDQIISSPLNDKSIVDIVAAIHAGAPFDVVVSFQEMGLLNAALIAERLGIFGNPLRPVMLTRDKGLMRQHMKDHGIPSIPFALVSTPEQAVEFAGEHGWPIVVKPANGVGSLHIHKLSSRQEVAGAFESINSDPTVDRLIRNDFPNLDIIAEKFVDGPEVSVEAITWNGRHTVLMVTDKMHSGYPHFVETGHSMPSRLPASTIEAIGRLTVAFLDSIGHVLGPSHTEIIVTADGPIIVESHTRTGGDNIFEMVELATGVDMFDATLKGLAGAFPEPHVSTTRTAAIRYWMPPCAPVAQVSGVELAGSSDGVVRCELSMKAGDPARPLRYSDDRPGYVLAVGTDGGDAIANVERAMGQVQIALVPETDGLTSTHAAAAA